MKKMNDHKNNSNNHTTTNDENNIKDNKNDSETRYNKEEENIVEHNNNTSNDNESNDDINEDDNDNDSSSNNNTSSIVLSEEDNEEDDDFNSSSSWSDYDGSSSGSNNNDNSNNSWNDASFSSSSYEYEDNAVVEHRQGIEETIIGSNNNNSFSSSDDNNNYFNDDNNEYTNNNNISRMRRKKRNNNDNSNQHGSTSTSNSSKDRKYRYKNRIKHNKNIENKINKRKIIVNIILFTSILLWIIVQIQYNPKYTNTNNLSKNELFKTLNNNAKKNVPEYILTLRKEREIKSKLALGSAASKYKSPNRNTKSSGGSKEKPPHGCHFTKWQLSSYPNCNDVHGTIDLTFDLGLRPPMKRNKKYIYSKPLDKEYGYIGSGLWRDVFKLPSQQVVLKIMKIEHENDERNIDRHRRDALIMEQLSSHDNIITPLAYCGTSIITPFYDLRLDTYLYPNKDEKHHKQMKSYNDDDTTSKTIPNFNVIPLLDRTTEYGRINLAYQISKSIKALHTLHGPAVHADIQTKQFLINTKTSTVLLSDFNRCRFMALHNNKESYCKFRIPSSPGKHRSPEEYNSLKGNKENLNEKLDIFSLGHVFYTILTGLPAISTLDKSLPTKNSVKRSIASGVHPLTFAEKEKYVLTKGDLILWNILERMYCFDVEERISSMEIVDILENHLASLKESVLQT